jgi:hypothetical protein
LLLILLSAVVGCGSVALKTDGGGVDMGATDRPADTTGDVGTVSDTGSGTGTDTGTGTDIPTKIFRVANSPAGNHTLLLAAGAGTTTDALDAFNATVIELPAP